MTNKITASLDFYFKGTHFIPSSVLDLDDLMQQHGTLPPIHQMLALLNKIDAYSYEYEMMLAEDIQFSNAHGDVKKFFIGGHFDQAGFEQQWLEKATLKQLAPIIKQELNIGDLSQHSSLKNVIITAYQLGKRN